MTIDCSDYFHFTFVARFLLFLKNTHFVSKCIDCKWWKIENADTFYSLNISKDNLTEEYNKNNKIEIISELSKR